MGEKQLAGNQCIESGSDHHMRKVLSAEQIGQNVFRDGRFQLQGES